MTETTPSTLPPPELPYDTEIEQALLGAVMVDNYWMEKLQGKLKPEHFYDLLHQRIYELMLMLWTKGHMISPLVLKPHLKDDEGLKAVGGYDYLLGMARGASALPNVTEYTRILILLATRRELVQIATDISELANSQEIEIDPSDLVEDAEQRLYAISEKSRLGSDSSPFEEVVDVTMKQAEAAFNRGGLLLGVPSGLLDLDRMLGGFHPSDLVIIAGRPGMGKTALATNIAFNAAKSLHNVLFFSLEMSKSQLGARILSDKASMEMWKIRNGKFTDRELEELTKASNDLRGLTMRIDDTAALSIGQISARARRQKRKGKLDLVIVDYIQLSQGSRRRNDQRHQEIGEVTQGLKAIAKELEVPVLALSQLSRAVDGRDDHRPVLSDLRESGSIEQDADVVMFVYREEYYLKSREPDPASPEWDKWRAKMDKAHRRAELIVEKHRNGPTGKVETFFDDKLTRFGNLVR